ncbi:hypothetical protein BJP40_14895 [Streptomyces sp. CC53]|uniref:hypothetical protein n=1 Tax=unclassified Streptomyces TaxID=2593676 RepID=UPI0008DCB999|nr:MULTISPECIES: hypothetical protein [unclassified Streptomyces]OII66005.1 hypothetical protein BJP40_14895 [Streptomyces sp. CC53]
MTRPAPPHPPAAGELTFRTHDGTVMRFPARFGRDRELPGPPGRLARAVTLGVDWTVLQYRIPAPCDPRAMNALEREAAAAVALERRYGDARFGEVFTRVVGYDLDAPEPFVLYRIADAEPLATLGGALGVAEQQRILAQLVLAVRLLDAAGFVHRAIDPETVRWDGRHVRLCEPYAALRTGEPREAAGTAPWASPEQRQGTGAADPRDDLWAVAQLMYFLLAGRPDRGAGPPADLADFRGLTALAHGGAFHPAAAGRPAPAELMRLLNAPDPLAASAGGPDPLARGRADHDAQLARKRATLGLGRAPDPVPDPPPRRSTFLQRLLGSTGAPPPPAEPPAPRLGPDPASPERLCPHCLLPVAYDETRLVTIDARGARLPLDLSGEHRPAHVADALRRAYQPCPHADEDQLHELPVPYLTHGRPLSIALVGSSGVGKTHLLAAMLGEVEQGGLEPYGLKCLPLNPDTHRTFLRERVQSLQQGRELGRTGQQTFARFADGLLVSGRGPTRPVVFFDLAGEDLAQDGEVARFLRGVDAFLFVLDPLRALRLASLDPLRALHGLRRRDLGDEAFTTVLNRIPRTAGPYVAASAALAVNKSDLIRVEPAVDRWLGRSQPPEYRPDEVREESRDAYAFVQRYATAAWLRPFDDCARCTLHFVAATGGEARHDHFPHGVRPRRVLAPLLSLFAMCGLLPGVDEEEVGIR